jgi:hypothetical protein
MTAPLRGKTVGNMLHTLPLNLASFIRDGSIAKKTLGALGIVFIRHRCSIVDVSNPPFEDGCKGALCITVQQNSLGFLKLRTITDVSQTFARALYIRYAEALR